MVSLKVTAVGLSAGVVLPKKVLAKLNVSKGDTLYLPGALDGSMRITPQDPEFACRVSITRNGRKVAVMISAGDEKLLDHLAQCLEEKVLV